MSNYSLSCKSIHGQVQGYKDISTYVEHKLSTYVLNHIRSFYHIVYCMAGNFGKVFNLAKGDFTENHQIEICYISF